MKEIIYTKNAPEPIGPYSQAVLLNGVLYASGQIGINPKTNLLSEGGVEAETEQVMKNVGAVLEAAGMDYSHIVKTSIFLQTMDDFPKVNTIYAKYFKSDFPARETVAVRTLPKSVLVEISVTASK